MKAEKRENLIDKITQFADEYCRGRVSPPLPSREVIRQALDEAIRKNGNGGWLKSPPKEAEKPLGNVLIKLLNWHTSSGNLMAIATLKYQVDTFIHKDFSPRWANTSWYADKSLPGATDPGLYEQLDTLAICLLGGKSTASDAWRKAIYGE